jgi:hypothetical protein
MQEYPVFDLTIPENAYIFGLLQTDGSLNKRKNRTKTTSLSIEIKKSDEDILLKLQKVLPVSSYLKYRKRNTNFKDNYESVSLIINGQGFRDELNRLGLPIGKKSEIISTPKTEYSKSNYWRGIIDGDGSLGFSNRGIPFVSLTTKSEKIAREYKLYLKLINGLAPKSNRNKRDNIYNIIVYRELAKNVADKLYANNTICLDRKYNLAMSILDWKPNVI